MKKKFTLLLTALLVSVMFASMLGAVLPAQQCPFHGSPLGSRGKTAARSRKTGVA